MNKNLREWGTKVLLGYLKSKKANAAVAGVAVLTYAPTYLIGRGMSETMAGIVVLAIAAIIALYLHAQGNADQGKAQTEVAIRREIIQAVLPRMVQGKIEHFKDVMAIAGFDVEDADKLATAMTQGQPAKDPKRSQADAMRQAATAVAHANEVAARKVPATGPAPDTMTPELKVAKDVEPDADPGVEKAPEESKLELEETGAAEVDKPEKETPKSNGPSPEATPETASPAPGKPGGDAHKPQGPGGDVNPLQNQ